MPINAVHEAFKVHAVHEGQKEVHGTTAKLQRLYEIHEGNLTPW
jgi:hypothetical protein